MKQPKVSVIVALYNKEKNIKKCITSLINQSLKEIEIIVVNDSSTDNSLEICKSFKDKRIRIISNKTNKGIGYTRNVGIKHAKGEYLAFVDADDYVDKQMYETYYNYCVNNEIDLLNTDYYKIIKGHKNLFKTNRFELCNINNNVNIINLINYGPCNKLVYSKIVKDNNILFDENNKYEDAIFVAKTINYAKKIGYLNKAFYNYVIHSESETTTVDERVFDIFKVMDQINNIYVDVKDTDELIYLNIVEITRYMLKQKYQTNRKIINDFIDNGFAYLDKVAPKWRKNKYYQKEPLFKRIVKNNKTIMKLYCKM